MCTVCLRAPLLLLQGGRCSLENVGCAHHFCEWKACCLRQGGLVLTRARPAGFWHLAPATFGQCGCYSRGVTRPLGSSRNNQLLAQPSILYQHRVSQHIVCTNRQNWALTDCSR